MSAFDRPPETVEVVTSPLDGRMTVADTRMWATLLHLSQLLNFVTAVGGFIAPVVIWVIYRAKSPEIDQHGKNVLNWLISSILYGMICGVLCFVLIGIPLLLVLLALSFIFPIMGALKAKTGIVWKYPLTISFF